MKFWEAIKALEEGKKVRRAYWEKDVYIHIDHDNILKDNSNHPQDLYYIPNDDDNDWEIYDDRKEAPYVLRKLAIELSQFDSDLNSLITTEDKKLIAELLVTLECRYKI